MPKKYPPEFKRDVVMVARRGDLIVPEVAADFGVSEESVRRWRRQADIDDGITDGQDFLIWNSNKFTSSTLLLPGRESVENDDSDDATRNKLSFLTDRLFAASEEIRPPNRGT